MIHPENYRPNEAWAVGRLDSFIFIGEQAADIYVLLDVASGYLFDHIVALKELPKAAEVARLLTTAEKTARKWPNKLLLPKGDPAEELFTKQAEKIGIAVEVTPLGQLESLLKPVRESFKEFSVGGRPEIDRQSPESERHASTLVPDSYDPCNCASGKKFKFCCKPIFREIIESMCAVEERRLADALRWLDQAKAKVGETGEVLCRYAIAYHLESEDKCMAQLKKTLAVAPNHPRAHYLMGIFHKERHQYKEAEASYLEAIKNYPGGDRYHLNETWNNLGSVYYEMKKLKMAKDAWEKALMYVPDDAMAKRNLIEYIYENDELPSDLRVPSPFVGRFL